MPSTTGSNRRRYAVHTRADENKWCPAPGTRKRAHNPTWCSKQVEAPGELHWSTSVPASCATMASDINRLHALMENKGCHRKALRRQGTSTMCCTTHSPMPHPAAINSQMSACFMPAWITIMFITIRANPSDVLSQVSIRYFAYQQCADIAIAYIFTWPACASNV